MTEDTLLHRQIHPSWVQNDFVSSQAFAVDTKISSLAFAPSEKDEKRLSVYNGVKFTAEESYKHYTLQLKSAGVLSLLVKEVHEQELVVNEDNTPFNGHTVIDFTTVASNNQITKKAKRLRDLAVSRGWTHKSEE